MHNTYELFKMLKIALGKIQNRKFGRCTIFLVLFISTC